jgi:hypothetical protein
MQQCVVAAAVVLAAGGTGTAQGQDARVTLSVKPVLCITDERQESCALSILVAWRSSRPGSYCLYNDLGSMPLRCWQLAEGGMVVEERQVQETVVYWLTDGAPSAARVAEASLDVMSASSDDRRRHRQRRHVWDIL